MTKKSRLELAVGIFILIGLGILVLFVFFIRDFQIIKPGYKFDVVFGFANGVKVGAPTRLAGVDVGEVKGIDISYDPATTKTKVRIRIWASKGTQIPADSKVWINTLGLLGEKYVEIIPGKNYALITKENDSLIGQDPVSMEEITEEAKKLISKMEESLNGLNEVLAQLNSGQGNIGKLFYDEEIYKNMVDLTDDLKHHPWKLLWKEKEKTK